jgi:AraC family transcriptional regulator
MPQRGAVQNRISNDLVSMRVYNEPLRIGDLRQEFDKWAAVEVSDFENIPEGMESFVLIEGLYAVFNYKGLNTYERIFVYILKSGCLIQITSWTKGPISKFLEANTKTMIPNRRKKSGYL